MPRGGRITDRNKKGLIYEFSAEELMDVVKHETDTPFAFDPDRCVECLTPTKGKEKYEIGDVHVFIICPKCYREHCVKVFGSNTEMGLEDEEDELSEEMV